MWRAALNGDYMIYGVGINDANYRVQLKSSKRNGNLKREFKVIWVCPYYRKWKEMLRRCYDKKFLAKSRTYVGCSVHAPWLRFSEFRLWCVLQETLYGVSIEMSQLDKDLLCFGNREYHPDKCLLLDKKINTLLTDSLNSRGEYPIGVTLDKRSGKFMARISKHGKNLWLGRFNLPEDAYFAWKIERISYLKEVAMEYEGVYENKISNSILLISAQLACAS